MLPGCVHVLFVFDPHGQALTFSCRHPSHSPPSAQWNSPVLELFSRSVPGQVGDSDRQFCEQHAHFCVCGWWHVWRSKHFPPCALCVLPRQNIDACRLFDPTYPCSVPYNVFSTILLAFLGVHAAQTFLLFCWRIIPFSQLPCLLLFPLPP